MRNARVGAFLVAVITAGSLHVLVRAQTVGQNVNIVTGSADEFVGDLFRQRQTEPVLGISSVNPSHMMAAYVDYRTVDSVRDPGSVVPPSLPQSFVAKLLDFLRAPWQREPKGPIRPVLAIAPAQAWIGLSFSDNGEDWYTGLLPGHPSGLSAEDFASPLTAYEAASDPVLATMPDKFLLGGIAFTPNGNSAGFVARFADRNNTETERNIQYEWTKVLVTQPQGYFVDKPSIAAGPGGRVYAAFVIFDQSDPQRLSSKIQVYRSANSGETWSGPVTVSEPLTRNQAPWIVVDPNNENTVYIGWRVFAARTGGIANAIVGKKSTNGGQSFTPIVPYPVALLLKAFDQPQGRLPASLPIPRSNAYPTAAIDGNGGIHVALQEYVYPPNHPTVALRGMPLGPNVSPTVGVPRITVTSSYTGGLLWTPRKAVDFGPGTGTQFVPVLTAVGEPGPSCAGSSGPRSRIMLMYYDARAGGAGMAPGSTGYVAGAATQFDVRIAQASACNRDGLGRLIFSPSELVSQYTRSAEPPHDIVTTSPPYNVTAVNRAYPMFCGGNCAFAGDYLHLSPRVPYVQTANGWRLTTANAVDKNKLPAPAAQGLWSDTRDVLLPTTGPLRSVLPAGASFIDALPWDIYQQPGTGLASCVNPGSRDGNIYMARYTPGLLFAAAPETFRVADIPRAYPVYVENRAGQQRFFRLTIDATANASFDFASFDTTSPSVLDREADIAIGPYSSVTGSVILGPGVNQSVLVTVEEIGVDQNGLPVAIPNAAKTTVTLYTSGQAASTGTETRTPVVSPTPEITFPFAGRLPITVSPTTPFSQNPFVHNPFSQNPFSQNPFSQNPFSQNPFSQNPFSQNPFSQNPFAQDETIYEVTDISFRVTNKGSFDAAFTALLNVQNALQLTGSYFFQVLINRASPASAMYFDQQGNCVAFDGAQPIQVSSIVTPFSQNPFSQNPFSQNPFSQNPFSQNPFSQNPFSQNPFSQNPFSQNPFSQNTDPRDPAVSNSSFYIAPQTSELPPTPEFRARRPPDEIIYTLRAYQIKANNDPTLVPLIPPGETQPPVGVVVVADTPEFIELPGGGMGFDPGGVPASSGGSDLPVQLVFVQQPTSTAPGGTITPPIQVAIQDGSGTVQPGSTVLVTLAIGANPGGGMLAGTTTRDDDDDGSVDGLVTFPGLSINNAGIGYTLVASSVGLTDATSTPFSITTAMCTPEPAGLVSWWPGNGSANDIRGGNNGTLVNGASFASGQVGQAFNLSGVNQYVDVADSGTLNPASAFTIDGWFYIDPNAAENAGSLSTLASKSTGGSADGGWFLIFDDGQLGNTPQFVKALRFAVFGAGSTSSVADANNVVTAAGWYHVAGTFDASASPQSNLYVNGALVASSTTSIVGISPNAVTMRIGAMHHDEAVGTTTYGSDRLNGLADEVHFFDRALTLANVQAIYNANGSGICAGATLVVTNTADTGVGSLRAAMTAANAVAGPAPPSVIFNIPSSGPYTIALQSPLPTMTRSVIIDGRTQPGYAGAPVILIQGQSAGIGANGLTLTGGSSQIRGLAIGGFSGSGILLQTGGNNRIAGNYLGTDVTGMTALGNNFGVHLLAGSSNNTIGGTIPGDGNLISGNATGVEIHGGANGNLVQGNTIGLNATGTTALGNSSSGIVIHNGGGAATNNTIGGTVAVARNVISGNVDGIVIRDSGTMGNQVQGNYIGTNAAGTAAVGGGTWGVLVTTNASNNVIGGTAAGAGNVIVGHSQAGIGISSGATGNVVQGNLIGLNAAGTAALGNTVGVLIQVSAVSNIVGGTTPASRNVISGNSQDGIRVNDVGSTGNQVRGNYIGTNAAGLAAIPNGTGVRVESAPGNFIGGTAPGEGNLISGNGGVGVVIDGVNGNGADGNVLQNNLIGTTADGSAALGNGAEGVVVHANYTQIGGTTPGARNVISGNTTYGIRVLNHGVGNVVEGNYIGTNLSGTAAIPNVDGVRIEQISGQRIGGSSPGAGNVISGNTQEGVYFFWCDLILPGCDAGNDVQGNRIGTRADGLTALPNGGNGIRIHAARNNRIGGTAAGAGNVVSGNIDAGIFIRSADGQPQTANGTVIQGNIIGLDAIGAASLGNGADGIGLTNAGAQIGGTQPGARNVISSNQNGIVFSNSGSPHTSLIEGNYIGTDITGMLDRGTGIGVSVGSAPGITIGGTAVGAGNVISGNQTGVSITNSSNTVVRGNIIGLNAAGTGPLGNSIGVTVTSGTRNTILTNSIFSNVGVGLGIDLGPAGVTPNDAGDADTGANDLQNFPVITSATTTQIQGTLNSTANTTFTIQLFTNAMCDASGNGEGQTMLGTVAGVSTDGSGNAVFSLTSPFAAPLAAGQYVTATATDSNGSTSEFSACTTVNAALAVLNTNDSGAGSLRQAILDAESNPDVSAIVFDIPGAGPHTIVPASPLPTTTTPVLIDGHSQPGASPGNPKIVLNGSAPGLGLGVSALTLGGASSLVRGLVINGFPGPGMTITSSGNTIRSNFIGTNPTGTAAVANAQGILIGSTATNNVIGGDLLDHRNIISGNSEWGIGIEGDGNSVLGNHVGTNVSGTAAVPNGGTGVVVFDGASGNIIGGTTAGAGNVIAGNGASGLGRGISATNVSGLTIQGNKIGTNASGTAALPNANQGIDFINVTGSLIGGIVAGAGNVISGNGGNPGIGGGDGIRLGSGSGTTIQGNKIGTDITGTTALPNVGDGINFNGASNSTVGGTVAGAGNLISGNSGPGIGIFGSSSGNHVEGNSIGLNASGTGGLANTDGVQVTGSGNFIGGTSPGAGNTVAFNQYNGVLVMFGTSNLISSNSIFSNGGIGIDLGGDGITANDGPVDGDAGANNLQNFPHISGVITTTSVAGEIFTAADVDFTVEIFSSDTANHEGKTLVTTTVVHTDLAGHAFIGPLPVTLTSGQWVTGTATDPSGNTSEFSDAVQVP